MEEWRTEKKPIENVYLRIICTNCGVVIPLVADKLAHAILQRNCIDGDRAIDDVLIKVNVPVEVQMPLLDGIDVGERIGIGMFAAHDDLVYRP